MLYLLHSEFPDHAWDIDLVNINALKELEFNVDHIHNIVHVLQTITSSKLSVIVLNPNGNHHNSKTTWNKLDTELRALSDRIQLVCEPEYDGSRLHVKLYLRSKDPNCDFVELAHQLLPQCVGRGSVTVFGAVAERLRANPEYLMC
jgi:hypothetical protein